MLMSIQPQLSQCYCGSSVLMDPSLTDCHLLPEEMPEETATIQEMCREYKAFYLKLTNQ